MLERNQARNLMSDNIFVRKIMLEKILVRNCVLDKIMLEKKSQKK